MTCPNCKGNLAVISTVSQPQRVFRRRACIECDDRFTSVETLDTIKFPWRKSARPKPQRQTTKPKRETSDWLQRVLAKLDQ